MNFEHENGKQVENVSLRGKHRSNCFLCGWTTILHVSRAELRTKINY